MPYTRRFKHHYYRQNRENAGHSTRFHVPVCGDSCSSPCELMTKYCPTHPSHCKNIISRNSSQLSSSSTIPAFKKISFVTELRPRIDVRSLGNLCLFLKSLGSSSIPHNEALGMEEMALMSNTRENVCLIIRNLTAHNSATKNFFSEQVIVQWLAEILLTSDHHEATQFHALFALAHVNRDRVDCVREGSE